MAETYFVLDASMALAWCFADENDAYTEQVLESLRHASALAPSVWPLEIANALVVAERRGRLTSADSAQSLAIFQHLPIAIEAESTPEIFTSVLALARSAQLSVYDASYLHLAMHRGLSLATQDNRLTAACLANGVALFQPLT